MQDIPQQTKLTNKLSTIMEKFGWQAVTAIFTVLATLIGTIVLGKIQVVNFSWLILFLALAQVIVTISCITSYYITRNKLQKRYQEHTTALEDRFRVLVEENNQKIKEAVADAEKRITGQIKNTETILTGTVKSYEGALDSQKQYLLHAMQPYLDTLEEKLRKELPTGRRK